MSNYANPEVLVSTDWVAHHKTAPKVVIAEVDVDTKAFDEGHVPGAIGWNWQTQLCDTVQRDIIPKNEMEKLMRDSGIANDTTVVLYGDNNNWFAAWAFWQMKIYGHEDVRLLAWPHGRKAIPVPTYWFRLSMLLCTRATRTSSSLKWM